MPPSRDIPGPAPPAPPAPPGPAGPAGPEVEVIPLGRVSATALAVVAAHLQALLELNALVLPARPDPRHCLSPTRGQYVAGLILRDLSAEPAPLPLRLGIIGHDLCLTFLTFVFGEAQLGGQAAVVSLHRLWRSEDGVRAPRTQVLERLAKVSLHETAHLLGLAHCRATGCLMRFSGGLAELDRLDLEFCPACQRQLALARLGRRAERPRAPEGPGLGAT